MDGFFNMLVGFIVPLLVVGLAVSNLARAASRRRDPNQPQPQAPPRRADPWASLDPQPMAPVPQPVVRPVPVRTAQPVRPAQPAPAQRPLREGESSEGYSQKRTPIESRLEQRLVTSRAPRELTQIEASKGISYGGEGRRPGEKPLAEPSAAALISRRPGNMAITNQELRKALLMAQILGRPGGRRQSL